MGRCVIVGGADITCYERINALLNENDFSEMELVKDTPVLTDDSYSCFSVLNITGTLQDITIENAKYPLQNAAIRSGYQYGISNEVIKRKK